jgi:DNA-binding transcriptional LysR family regulator
LPLFVAVADAGSMSAAARALGWPKSSVSRGIAALEAALGVQLFHRSTRQISLSTAGTAFLDRARPLVAAFKELTASLPEQETEPKGELRLTMPVDIAQTFLVEVAAGFSLRYPGVQLDVRPTDRVVDLVGEGFDAALRISARLKESSLVARKVGQIELAIYASPNYLARRGTPRTTEETAEHDWVAVPGLKLPKGIPGPKRPRLSTTDLVFAHGATVAGVGLALLPTFLVGKDLLAGTLVRVLPRWSVSAGSLYFVYPPSAHVPRKVAAFRDFLLDFLAKRPVA